MTVPTGHRCGLCHKDPCGCKTVACTTYTKVPVVKDVVVTRMVPETQTRQVPVHRTRYVQEVVNDVQRITKCRMVQEVVTEKVPHVTWVCVPKTVTKQIPHKVCEQVAVTCYRKVSRMVPCGAVEYAAAPAGRRPVDAGRASPRRSRPPAPSIQGACRRRRRSSFDLSAIATDAPASTSERGRTGGTPAGPAPFAVGPGAEVRQEAPPSTRAAEPVRPPGSADASGSSALYEPDPRPPIDFRTRHDAMTSGAIGKR